MTIHVQHPNPGYTGSSTINRRTIHFKDGQAKAEEGTNLTAFRRAGYTLSRDEIVELESLTVPELRQYAAAHDIDLTGAKVKADIVDVISSAPSDPVEDPNAE